MLEALIAKCPADRQICLFSATFPVTVKGFKQKFLPNAFIINLMDELTLRGISQFYAFVEERQKVRDYIKQSYKFSRPSHTNSYDVIAD